MNLRPTTSSLATALSAGMLATCLAAPALAQAPGAAPALPAAIAQSSPVAKVNGVAIPSQRAELLLRERAQAGQQDGPQLRAAVRDELVNREIINQEAVKTGLTKSPELQNELELVRQTVIVQAFLREFIRNNPVTDAEMQQQYEQIKSQLGTREYKARHVLVASESEAKAIVADLKKGANFADLAKKNTMDQGTKEKGGELGWQSAATFDKDFASALVKLGKGKYTETPVKTRFGYHVIQLEDTREAKHPSFADAKNNLKQRLQRVRIEKLISELRAKAKVE